MGALGLLLEAFLNDKEIENVRISRGRIIRDTGKEIAAALAALSGIESLLGKEASDEGTPKDESYKEWYRMLFSGIRGEAFEHPYFPHKKAVPSVEQIRISDSLLMEKSDITAEDFYGLVRQGLVSHKAFKNRTKLYYFPDEPDLLLSFSERSNMELAKFFSYAGIPCPEIRFQRLAPESKFPDNEGLSATGFLVSRFETEITAVYSMRGTNADYLVEVVWNDPDLGIHLLQVEYDASGKGLKLNPVKNAPIIYTADSGPAGTLYALICETFHFALRRATFSHLKEEAESVEFPEGSELKDKAITFSRMVKKWVQREEGIVHAIADMYFAGIWEGYRFGNKYEPVYRIGDAGYALVPSVTSFLKHNSPAKAIQAYRENDERIFGNNMAGE